MEGRPAISNASTFVFRSSHLIQRMKILQRKFWVSRVYFKVSVGLNHNKKRKGVRPDTFELEDIPCTRRVYLRLVNGIFDPLGIFTPITVTLKILMKEQFFNCDKYKKWDTLLESKDRLEWVKVVQDVLKLNEISILRHLWNAPYCAPNTDGKFILVGIMCVDFTERKSSGYKNDGTRLT